MFLRTYPYYPGKDSGAKWSYYKPAHIHRNYIGGQQNSAENPVVSGLDTIKQ